ncbi:C39 family peptidase [Micromonospora zhanjiangensis]|uniref:C39 family peptidase n=1 Tax=Micromonospora zhanjiangensis TaxID=1522057 RepID=A0ABV8KJD5_9ACTN
MRTPLIRRTVLTAAGLALTGGAIAGPAVAAHAAEPAHTKPHAATVTTDRGGDHGNRGGGNGAHGGKRAKDVAIKYESQPNFYYCGPASTRIALTATGHDLSQDEIAKALGTTEAGTASAEDTTRVLNTVLGADKYKTTALPTTDITAGQIDTLKSDIKATIDDNRAVVANVAGVATDTDGAVHDYSGGHYVSVVGYQDDGDLVKIADPANPNVASYWIHTDDLAHWMATHGYSH